MQTAGTHRPMTRSRGWRRVARKIWHKLPTYLSALIILFMTLAPAYWLFVSAISYNQDLTRRPPQWFPSNPTYERLISLTVGGVVQGAGIGEIGSPAAVFRRSILNSFGVAITTTLLCLFLGSLTAYAFTRLRFPMKGSLLLLAITAQMVPPIVLVIPLYQVMRALKLIDTLGVLVILYSSFILVYVIWVMTGFFRTIPQELEESALIDGCTRLGALFRVILPLSLPGLFATGLLCFLLSWDEFMYALIFTSSVDAKTITVAIGEFTKQYTIDYGMMMAGGLVASIPPLILALIFQRSLVSGLTAGAVKG